ncbi:sulfite exporter TauE/SafE family protein [uncultured Pseudoteredinibacter sp.]|uniref:sulfite exporter TauE/SafE family protein n=1 Tax=uncultured Pseudoteredinibacter sp. TaxID=1641701 RepID=UPI0026272461|nr:sulfite exporter TauE/SafE family protein [uncultured Pseudoteredinibacter sp.]
MLFLIYAVLGVFAGIIAGLFGVGGGIIIVPVLIYSFGLLGFPAEHMVHMAIATSLACIVTTSVSSIYAHHKKGAVDWALVSLMVPGIAVGSWLGGMTAVGIKGEHLQIIIGVFALYTAWKMWNKSKQEQVEKSLRWPLLVPVSTGVGWASAIFGIGGGSLTVPFLSSRGVQAQKAVACGAALGFPIALVGTLSFIYSGLAIEGLPDQSFGLVYWPAWIGIAVFSTLSARFGAQLAHKLSPQLLQRCFAGFLCLVGLNFMLSGIMASL